MILPSIFMAYWKKNQNKYELSLDTCVPTTKQNNKNRANSSKRLLFKQKQHHESSCFWYNTSNLEENLTWKTTQAGCGCKYISDEHVSYESTVVADEFPPVSEPAVTALVLRIRSGLAYTLGCTRLPLFLLCRISWTNRKSTKST